MYYLLTGFSRLSCLFLPTALAAG